MIGRPARPCMNLCGMYRLFGVVPQGLDVLFPVVLGGNFRCSLLVIFSGPCSWGFDGGNLWEPFVELRGQIRELRGSILVVFVGARVLEVRSRDL
jgi:hypothetical protein